MWIIYIISLWRHVVGHAANHAWRAGTACCRVCRTASACRTACLTARCRVWRTAIRIHPLAHRICQRSATYEADRSTRKWEHILKFSNYLVLSSWFMQVDNWLYWIRAKNYNKMHSSAVQSNNRGSMLGGSVAMLYRSSWELNRTVIFTSPGCSLSLSRERERERERERKREREGLDCYKIMQTFFRLNSGWNVRTWLLKSTAVREL